MHNRCRKTKPEASLQGTIRDARLKVVRGKVLRLIFAGYRVSVMMRFASRDDSGVSGNVNALVMANRESLVRFSL
jgi:hypothetical protein